MKNFILFFFLSILSHNLMALSPETDCSLYHHLTEVNKEWEKQNIPVDFFEKTIAFKNDRERIRMHLSMVGFILNQRDTKHLNTLQKQRRAHHLDVLKDYAAAGIFPINTKHQSRQPYFIDFRNTACAVGHLVRKSGHTDLVERIAAENNYAYLEELLYYSELTAWAEENGFTTAELAWIQPGYPPQPKVIHQVGTGVGANGAITVIHALYNKIYFAGDFTEMDGLSANGIVAWDGENWETFGQGISGEIDVLEGRNNPIVAGHFTILSTGEESRLAVFQDGEWQSIVNADFTGEINDVILNGNENSNARILIAGEFNSIGGIDSKNIAVYNAITGSWSGGLSDCNLETNAAVNALYERSGKYFIAGEFSEISLNCDGDETILETNALAVYDFYDHSLSMQPFVGGFEKLDEIHVHNGIIRAFEHQENATYLHGFTGGTWESLAYYQPGIPENAAALAGFTTNGAGTGSNKVLLYGNLQNGGELVTIFGNGIVGLNPEGYPSSAGLIEPNGAIHAAAYFDGLVYFAGDFTEIQDESYPGLAASNFELSTSSTEPSTEDLDNIQVFQAEQQLIIRYYDLEEESLLTLYDLKAQSLREEKISPGSGQTQIDIGTLPPGVYVYAINNSSGRRSGKVIITN